MEYKIKIHCINKNIGLFIVGIVWLLLLLTRMVYDESGILTWLYSVLYGGFGVVLLFDSLGYTFNRADIDINNRYISIRLGVLNKKQTVEWNKIEKIEVYNKRLLFRLLNNKITYIITTRLPSEYLNQTIKTISELAKNKNVNLMDLTLD